MHTRYMWRSAFSGEKWRTYFLKRGQGRIKHSLLWPIFSRVTKSLTDCLRDIVDASWATVQACGLKKLEWLHLNEKFMNFSDFDTLPIFRWKGKSNRANSKGFSHCLESIVADLLFTLKYDINQSLSDNCNTLRITF